MKRLFFIVLVFWVHHAVAQNEDVRLKPVVDSFVQHYNDKNYEGIFNGFSSSMKQHLPEDKVREFMGGLHSQAGKILDREIIWSQASQSSYKTLFERSTLIFEIAIDKEGKINRLLFKPYVADSTPELIRNKSKLNLPFKGAWMVIWGGDSPELNYHVESNAQKNAFDFLIIGRDGKSHRTDGKNNEDYYAFGQEIIAPCDGEVVIVVDGIKDNTPGMMNPLYVPGNTVVIKTSNGEYLFFAHLMQYSIKVKPGDSVKEGQVLGLCGNSGNSSEPHLHFHIQNVEDINMATGAKAYFDRITVGGELKVDYSPIKGDIVQPVD